MVRNLRRAVCFFDSTGSYSVSFWSEIIWNCCGISQKSRFGGGAAASISSILFYLRSGTTRGGFEITISPDPPRVKDFTVQHCRVSSEAKIVSITRYRDAPLPQLVPDRSHYFTLLHLPATNLLVCAERRLIYRPISCLISCWPRI